MRRDLKLASCCTRCEIDPGKQNSLRQLPGSLFYPLKRLKVHVARQRPQQEATMGTRKNIIWALYVALLASAALNGCALENLPLSNSPAELRAERPFNPMHSPGR